MNKAYYRINGGKGWVDYPSDDTALNAYHLNHMEVGIDTVDTRVTRLDDIKASKEEVAPLIADVDFDEKKGTFTFIRKDSVKYKARIWDTKLEQLVENLDFDKDTQQLIITRADGTPIHVDVSAFVKPNEFLNSDTVSFSIEEGGKVKAIIIEGSIEEKHLRPDYLADIRIEQGKAQQSAADAEEHAKISESYAHGGAGVREDEDSDNAMEYARQAKESADRAEEIISSGSFPITIIQRHLTLTSEWTNAGIEGGDLEDGVYIVCVKPAIAGEFSRFKEVFAGIMCWYSGIMTGMGTREIILHASGKNVARNIFLRTMERPYQTLALQIAIDYGNQNETAVDFEFRKLL